MSDCIFGQIVYCVHFIVFEPILSFYSYRFNEFTTVFKLYFIQSTINNFRINPLKAWVLRFVIADWLWMKIIKEFSTRKVYFVIILIWVTNWFNLKLTIKRKINKCNRPVNSIHFHISICITAISKIKCLLNDSV